MEILQILHGGQDKIKAFLQELELEEQQSNSRDKEEEDEWEESNRVAAAEWSDDDRGGLQEKD